MPTDAEIKRMLKSQDREFSKLAKQHTELEKRLEGLEKRAYLNPQERMEVKKIKKRKLKLKDKMEAMIRKHRNSLGNKQN